MPARTKQIDLDTATRIHLIGIGGIGMSALARFLTAEKKVVSGSDRILTPLTHALASEGIQVMGEQSPENISRELDLVIYSEAVPEDHPERVAATKARIPTVSYFTALGAAMNPYYLIAVAGTHGKTTTTAMLTDVFEAAGKDPTAIIGSLRASTKQNFRYGKSKYAIVEACEYRRDFLSLRPDVLVILNLEHEHPDYYADLADVQAAFRSLIEQVNEGGVVVTNPKDPNIAPILEDAPVRVVDYTEALDLSLPLRQPGLHNRYNAAAALSVATLEKLDRSDVRTTLSQFAGTWRRFEYKGECRGAAIFDDYAHHPTEIAATLAGARELYPRARLTIIFQPHTFSRTAALFGEFARALAQADRAYILPIYGAREINEQNISSRELAVRALEFNSEVSYVESFEAAQAELMPTLSGDDVVIVMGAGDVTDLASELTRT